MMQRWSNKMAEPLRILMRRGVLFVMVTIMAVITSLSPFVTQPANAAVGDFSLGGNSCAVETVGWVLCPTMRSIARLADKGFVYINRESLSIQYSLFGGNSRTFATWEIMRNIANALFVIVFLYIIYTYLVGRNGGYSFKRLLPRLLIAAIAVNLSYYLGVILVDISNIVGDSLWEIMKNIYGSGNSNPVMPLGGSPRPEDEGNITKMASAVMGSTGMVWALLPPLAIVSISVAVISAAMVILVIMREALVATLILASPVLIVLYLLPNLERFASQAMQLFIQLLILYPIIAVLLGTGQIVSLAAGSWGVESTFYGGGSTSVVPDLIAAAAAVVPLLGIWFVFKNLSSVMSSAGSRLSASIKSRGGKDDKDARVTGKATAGAAAVKNSTGLSNPLGRKSAFNRNRRRKSLSGSALTSEASEAFGEKGPAARRADSPFEALQNALSGGADKDTKKQDELKGELAGAEVNAENPNEVNLEKAAAESLNASMDGKNEKQPDKPKTAKDIFNNLNRGHEAKDKDRKFSAGPGVTGGQQAQGGTAQPSAPSTSYRAPSLAQGGNIVSGTSDPQQPVQIVAVPVQIDGSALLGQNQHRPPENVSQPPVSGTEEKAKARAQKYLFEADESIKDAENEIDILKHGNDKPFEQPHTSRYDEKKDDDE